MATIDSSDPAIIPVKYPCPVRRVTVNWNGKEWKITKQVIVPSMTLPAPDPLPAGNQSQGFWIEVTNGKGGIFQREVLVDPLMGMEQFDEGGKIYRLTHPVHAISLEFLLPYLPDVAELHIVSNPSSKADLTTKKPQAKRTILKLSDKIDDKPSEHPDEHHH